MSPNLKSNKMKKLLVVLLGVALTSGAMAQTKDVKMEEKQLKNTIKDKKMDKHEAGKDLKNVRMESAKDKRKEVRMHRKTIHREVRHLKNEGVEHPKRDAQRAAKKDKDIRKGKE